MKNILTLLFACLICLQINGQELKQQADQAFGDERWNDAIMLYTKHLKKNKKDSSAWYSLATSQMNTESYDDALESFGQAKATNFNPHFVNLSIAKIHAVTENSDKLYSSLEEAAEQGLFTFARLEQDAEFDNYRDSEQFQAILKKVELNAYPCLSNPVSRHFDFWIGEWDVFVNGNKVGENYITRAKGGCAIHENYITTRNYAGQSINFYSPVDKKWHQHWVGSSGDVYNYMETKREEGMLQFVSDFMTPQGTVILSRLTLTLNEDGTVRQLFESSTDDGESWSPAFDGLYKRKE